jgi:hypothetical protein
MRDVTGIAMQKECYQVGAFEANPPGMEADAIVRLEPNVGCT